MLENFKFGLEKKTIYISVAAFVALIILIVILYFVFRNKTDKPKFTNVSSNEQHTD